MHSLTNMFVTRPTIIYSWSFGKLVSLCSPYQICCLLYQLYIITYEVLEKFVGSYIVVALDLAVYRRVVHTLTFMLVTLSITISNSVGFAKFWWLNSTSIYRPRSGAQISYAFPYDQFGQCAYHYKDIVLEVLINFCGWKSVIAMQLGVLQRCVMHSVHVILVSVPFTIFICSGWFENHWRPKKCSSYGPRSAAKMHSLTNILASWPLTVIIHSKGFEMLVWLLKLAREQET